MKTLVKFCGITQIADALYADELGVDFIGLIFCPQSPRCISITQAAEIHRALAGKSTTIVGVFRHNSLEDIKKICIAFNLKFVQLHGEILQKNYFQLSDSISKFFSYSEMPHDVSHVNIESDYLLFDTDTPGTGQLVDWDKVASYKSKRRCFLSGGLNINNIHQALQIVKLSGVDVASGIEQTYGKKNKQLMRNFIEAVKQYDHSN